jgi:hypothetical protein
LICAATRKDGLPCTAQAVLNGLCIGHQPGAPAARSKGGRNSSRAARLRGLIPPRLVPVYDKLETALEEVHTGQLESKQATAMAALARAMVAVLTTGELEERVRALETKDDQISQGGNNGHKRQN